MICWIDTETTGLKPREGHLLEVALVVTDDDLNEVSHFSTVVQPVGVSIDQIPMDDVVREMHSKNGLFDELRAGGGMLRHEAEERLLIHLVYNDPLGIEGKLAGDVELDVCANCKKKRDEHVERCNFIGMELFCPEPAVGISQVFSAKRVPLASQTPLAGSTVGFDRAWLKEHMPKLEALFSYRSVDVSSITELAKRWAPNVYEARPRAERAAHRALADVRESIAILRYYRDRGFIGGGNFA